MNGARPAAGIVAVLTHATHSPSPKETRSALEPGGAPGATSPPRGTTGAALIEGVGVLGQRLPAQGVATWS
jgi:hypothetical protein